MSTITYQDFQKVDIRVGRVVKVEDFPEAKNPSYKLTIDFGPEVGVKVSSGQFVGAHPIKEKLVGKFVLGVVNFPPKQIGPFISETLTLGVQDMNGNWVVVGPDKEVPLGGRLG